MLSKLNERQLQAVTTVNGPVLVVAGAGSGKTRALTLRIANLIKNHNVSPYNILAITFTNKATNEMRERLRDVDKNNLIHISTFHSLCAKILRLYIHNLEGYNKYFTIYDEDEKDKVIKKIVESKGLKSSEITKTASEHISNAKNMGLDPYEYKKQYAYLHKISEIFEIYLAYEEQLKKNNALDFDDLLSKTYYLLKTNEHVLFELQERFVYIHVDEFQDTNTIQYKILKLLANKHKNIFVVGDEDQCIYGWRGASIENTNLFINDFNPQIIKLEQNYRSTKNVLKHANQLIKNNKARLEKELWTENEEGESVRFYKAFSDQDEAEFVVKSVYNFIQNGIPANEIAILFRLGALSRLFEEKLLNYNIPYTLYGAFKFYERLEIKNILSYLKLIYNKNDNEAVKRIINYPKRGIGKTSIDKIEEIADKNNVSMYYVITNYEKFDLGNALNSKLSMLKAVFCEIEEYANNNKKISDVFRFVLDITKIREQYDKKIEEDNERLLNIGQLELSVLNFEHNNPEAELIDFLQSVTLENQQEDYDQSSSVKVSTVHAVKGLEFTCVFVVGVEEGLFPISRAFGSESELEEERRLMYVAVTRSKKYLTITCADSRYLYNSRNSMLPSRFLKEMDLIKYTPASAYTLKSGYTNFKNASFENYKTYNGSEENDVKITTGLHNYAFSNVNFNNNLTGVMQKKLKEQAKKFESFTVGTQVLHPKFGVGEIIKNNVSEGNNSVEVRFSGYGVKCLNLEIAPLQILQKKD